MFKDIYEKIKEFDNIIIHRHKRPDGDCIGSQIGLKYIIKESFPEKNVYSTGKDVPDYLKSMIEIDEVPDELYKDALVIVVDTATQDRISDDRWKNGKFIIKIDHHDDSPEYADINYIDPTAPACAQIIVRMVRELDGLLKLNQKAAKYLYYGFVTDTGRFMYRGVSSETLENAGMLLKENVDIEEIYDSLYIKKIEELRLEGHLYKNYKLTPNGVIYYHFTKKDLKKFNVSIEDASNMVNKLSGIEGSLIWVAFIDQTEHLFHHEGITPKQEKNEVRCRIRSRHVQVNDIATRFRGGGHLQAAGATVYSKKEMNDILQELDQRLAEYKKENPNAR